MTAPETYTVDRDTLMAVLLSGYRSAMATAVANRDRLAAITSVHTDDDAMEFGQLAAERIDNDPASHDAAWRAVLACMSGVDMPTVVIRPDGGGADA